MSGENRRYGGWILPVIVVAAGAYFLYDAIQKGTLSPAALSPVNWVGVGMMAAGLIGAVAGRKNGLVRLAATLICGVGAILVICL